MKLATFAPHHFISLLLVSDRVITSMRSLKVKKGFFSFSFMQCCAQSRPSVGTALEKKIKSGVRF